MGKKAGEKTGQFGLWLTKALKDYPQYQVVYDHGNRKEHANVAVIKAFIGDKVTKDNKLADIDVVVTNRAGEILLLIEIEESPISPKTLLGDVFASLFSSGFAANIAGKQNYFRVTPQTQLWVAGYVSSENSEKYELIDMMQDRINQIVSRYEEGVIDQVRLIFKKNLVSCLETLRSLCLDYLRENPQI